jgi:hypothetical protein
VVAVNQRSAGTSPAVAKESVESCVVAVNQRSAGTSPAVAREMWMSFPGAYHGADEPPRSGCGCLVVAALCALIVVSALVALAIYATDVMDAGWRPG